ncbi:c-type cytochrome [uncultured Paludibaculum sp.]|uniref:c-type cytochrome n=1 Tax=uncultured Paludibaculum sp. TaxID=1765020 RepID=UPI002AAC0FD0|nr:c-type cytochrome [uncultured Paludibaculum sp.]
MDFPIFHLDWLGNRMLVALTAIVHVLINHPLAVGAYPLLTLFEWIGVRRADPAWDALTRRIVFVVFVITTSLGALTGVGIWLTTSVVAPFAIGSLLRVFFWQWFTEWLVFVSEVLLILAYYLTWDHFAEGRRKRLHIAIGATLSAFSWLTMALIVAILGFMMSSGRWTRDQGFFSAVFNPLYLPQLAFRTTFAMTTAGLFVWFCASLFTRGQRALREDAVRLAARWSLAWLPPLAASAFWYWRAVPAAMKANTDVALLTQGFAQWHTLFLRILAATAALLLTVLLLGVWRPRLVPRAALLVPFLLSAWLLGHFERVREFIRKPYVIAGYMYSNGVRVDELPVFQRDGILPYATYTTVHQVTSSNQWQAGRDLFLLTCSRCHTVDGINGVTGKLNTMLGSRPWTTQRITNFLAGMHLTRTYMPPFPGSPVEAEALAIYLRSLQPGVHQHE